MLRKATTSIYLNSDVKITIDPLKSCLILEWLIVPEAFQYRKYLIQALLYTEQYNIKNWIEDCTTLEQLGTGERQWIANDWWEITKNLGIRNMAIVNSRNSNPANCHYAEVINRYPIQLNYMRFEDLEDAMIWVKSI